MECDLALAAVTPCIIRLFANFPVPLSNEANVGECRRASICVRYAQCGCRENLEFKTCLSLANNIYRNTNRLVYYNNRIGPSDLPHFFTMTVQRACA